MPDTIEDLRAKLAEAEALLSDCASMLENEEDSVREEHADLVERVEAYQFSGLPEPEPVVHEYAFDVFLTTAIRVKATSEIEARRTLAAEIDANSANLGAWSNGDPILAEVSLAYLTPITLYEIDGKPTNA